MDDMIALREVSIIATNEVAQGMHSAIIRATKLRGPAAPQPGSDHQTSFDSSRDCC
jgi:hypothetical protein